MENEELLTTSEEETEDIVEITDGEPKVSETPQQTESLTLAVEDPINQYNRHCLIIIE